MPQYAYFDPDSPSPHPVLGWYDTEKLHYSSLPGGGNLIEMTPEQWAARLTGQWAVDRRSLVPYSPPAPEPTLAQQAAALLATGLTVTSGSDANINGTYPCDPVSQQRMQAEVISIFMSETFADGEASTSWIDVDGVPHAPFSIIQFKSLATAIGAFVAGCTKCITGQSTTLPSSTAEIA